MLLLPLLEPALGPRLAAGEFSLDRCISIFSVVLICFFIGRCFRLLFWDLSVFSVLTCSFAASSKSIGELELERSFVELEAEFVDPCAK